MTAPVQRDAAWLNSATPEQVAAAHAAGELAALLGGTVPDIPAEGQLTDEHLRQMTPEQITAAHAAGRLTDVLTTAPPAPARVRPPGAWGEQLTEGAAHTMSPEQLVEAEKAGRLDFVLGRVPGVPVEERSGSRGSGEF